jgi:integrase
MSENRIERGIFEWRGEYWIRWTDSQKRQKRERAGLSLAGARKQLARRRDQALTGVKLPENLRTALPTFKECSDTALAWAKLHKRSWRDDESRIPKLCELLGARPAEDLTAREIELALTEAARENGWQASTYNHYRSQVGMVIREARRAGLISGRGPILRDVKHKTEDNSRIRSLDRTPGGEFDRLTEVIRRNFPEHFPEFVFALNTGLRLSNQYAATYESINWTTNVLTVPTTKNGKPVYIPLNSVVMAALKTLPSWAARKGRIFRSQREHAMPVLSNDHWFKPALKAAGIEDFHWHDLRHDFATNLLQSGVALERVSRLLGHKSLNMTLRYAHLAQKQLMADVEGLTGISTTLALEPEVKNASTVSLIN